MPAKIIMVVEYQDARIRVGLLIKEGCGEAADTGPNHHQVVIGAVLIQDSAPIFTAFPGQLVGDFERTRVATPQSHIGRRQVGIRFLPPHTYFGRCAGFVLRLCTCAG